MDELWAAEPCQWSLAQAEPLEVEGRRLPYRYEAVYEPSVVWSVIGLHRTVEQLGELEERAVFPISRQHAEALGSLLGLLADRVEALSSALADLGDPAATRDWADATARLVGEVHRMTAALDPDPPDRPDTDVSDTAAWIVVPVLQALASATGDTDALEPARLEFEIRRTERMLARIILNTSFRFIGRALPAQALDEVLAVQRSQAPARARRNTALLLLWYRHITPQAYKIMPSTAEQASAAAGRLADGLRYMAEVAGNWPRLQMLALEVRHLQGRRLVGLEFQTQRGAVVGFRNLDLLAPDVLFAGHGQIIIEPGPENAPNRVAVHFQAVGDGGVVLGFDSPVYTLVRWLAFPLKTSRLRQVRYRDLADETTPGTTRLVELLLEDLDDRQDPRRMIRVRTHTQPVFEPRPDLPPRLRGRQSEVLFEFLTPTTRYHYTHESFDKPELWQAGR